MGCVGVKSMKSVSQVTLELERGELVNLRFKRLLRLKFLKLDDKIAEILFGFQLKILCGA